MRPKIDPVKREEAIALLLTRPQKKEIAEMTACGYSRLEAVRHLLRLGVLVRKLYPDLELDLTSGTRYALKDNVKRKDGVCK